MLVSQLRAGAPHHTRVFWCQAREAQLQGLQKLHHVIDRGANHVMIEGRLYRAKDPYNFRGCYVSAAVGCTQKAVQTYSHVVDTRSNLVNVTTVNLHMTPPVTQENLSRKLSIAIFDASGDGHSDRPRHHLSLDSAKHDKHLESETAAC